MLNTLIRNSKIRQKKTQNKIPIFYKSNFLASLFEQSNLSYHVWSIQKLPTVAVIAQRCPSSLALMRNRLIITYAKALFILYCAHENNIRRNQGNRKQITYSKQWWKQQQQSKKQKKWSTATPHHTKSTDTKAWCISDELRQAHMLGKPRFLSRGLSYNQWNMYAREAKINAKLGVCAKKKQVVFIKMFDKLLFVLGYARFSNVQRVRQWWGYLFAYYGLNFSLTRHSEWLSKPWVG